MCCTSWGIVVTESSKVYQSHFYVKHVGNTEHVWDRNKLNRGGTNKFNLHWYSKMNECNFCFAEVAAWLFWYDSFLQSTTITDSDGESRKTSGRWTSPRPNNNTTVPAHTLFRVVFNPFAGVSSQLSLPALCPWNSQTQQHLNSVSSYTYTL